MDFRTIQIRRRGVSVAKTFHYKVLDMGEAFAYNGRGEQAIMPPLLYHLPATGNGRSAPRGHHAAIQLYTGDAIQFIDLTEKVAELVRGSGISEGLVNVQTRHTTAAVLVNENEPLLIEDMKRILRRLAPLQAAYRHDDLPSRAHVEPGEGRNGHAHCQALFLRTSETINIAGGELQLGPWQRIFFVELDKPRRREVSVQILGC